MADSMLAVNGPIIALEQKADKFATAKTLAGDGFTIPENAGEIWCYPSDACHWHPTGTPTSTFGHKVRANEMFLLKTNQQAAKIIGDAGAITLTVAYMKGARRGDGKGGMTRPY